MDAITPEQSRIALEAGWKMRVGRKLKRTLYLHQPDDDPTTGTGICVGIVDNEKVADLIVALWNSNAIHTRAYIEDEYGDLR